jgi:hypothetical protein
MKGLLLLTGESFREGLQLERKRDTKKSFYPQKMASESHVDFCNYIKEKHDINMDIFITTYDTKYEKELKSWYPKLWKYKNNKNLFGEKIIQEAVNDIDKDYDFIFITRMDIFIKPYFYDVFNPKWKTIYFMSQHETRWKCGMIDGSPIVNPTFQFIPKKYFNVLTNVSILHESWKIYHDKFNIPHSKLNFMVDTYHNADSYKDYNPYYRYVGRPECTIWHDRGKKINRKLFGKKRTCKKIKSLNWKSKTFKQYHLP